MSLSIVRMAFFVSALASTGCVGVFVPKQENNELTRAGYQDSASDVVNRAPASMTPPAQSIESPTVDSLHLRAQADFHFTLAESYSLEGNSARAIEEYKLTLLYDNKSALVRLRLSAEYVKQGLVSEALEQAKACVEIDPQYQDGHLLLGGLYSALRMYEEALSSYRKVLEINPDNIEAPMFMGALLAEQKKFDESAKIFEGLSKNPKNSNPHLAYYYLAQVYRETGKDSSRVEVALKQAVDAKPNFPDAVSALGQLFENSKRRNEAVQLYRNYQEKHGPDGTIAENLARLYLEDEDYLNASRQLQIVESKDTDNLNVKVKLAFILIEQKRYTDAIVKLEEILGRVPSSDKVRFYLGAVFEEVKDYNSAIGHFEKIPLTSSFFPEAIIHTAYLHKLNGDLDAAIKTVQNGIKQKEDHAQFYALYASFLDEKQDFSAGVTMLTKAVEKFPDHAQLHFFLGSMQDKLGNQDGTIKSMRRVLEIEKDHVQALNYLAYTFAERATNLDEAEALARRALHLQPGDAYVMDTLGWVLVKRNAMPEALKMLEAAYKLQPSESIIAEHLGDAYYKYQLPEKAKKMYQKAKEVETNPENQQKLRAKIVSLESQIQSFSAGSEVSRKPASVPEPQPTK